MNRKMRQQVREIERRGGMVFVSDAMPEDLAEMLLDDVLDCPACNDEEDDSLDNVRFFDAVSIGNVLVRRVPKKNRGH